jgi:RNA polymerase sigma-70 factor (ECF subfamily)
MSGARAGLASDVAELICLYRPYLQRLAERKLDAAVRPKEGSSDLVQVTIIEGQAGFPCCAADNPAALRLWLRRILFNNLRDLHRRYRQAQRRDVRRERSLDDVEYHAFVAETSLQDDETPSERIWQDEKQAIVHEAIAGLKPEYQEAIVLRYQDGLTFAEIGEVVGLTPGAAESLVKRAVLKLGRVLNQHPDLP